MSKQLLSHVFSTVMHLERSLAEIDSLTDSVSDREQIRQNLAQQTKVVRQMRVTANKLQMAVAADNTIDSHRFINIFYALNQIIRPEIMKSLASLLNPNVRIPASPARHAAH